MSSRQSTFVARPKNSNTYVRTNEHWYCSLREQEGENTHILNQVDAKPTDVQGNGFGTTSKSGAVIGENVVKLKLTHLKALP